VKLVAVNHRTDQLPAMVVESDPGVINNHGDFFRFELVRWLSGYVAKVQRERVTGLITKGRTK